MPQPTPVVIPTKTVDPCKFASANTLRSLLNTWIKTAFPISKRKRGARVTLSNPQVTEAHCPNLSIGFRVNIKYKKSRGFPQFSTKGDARLTAKVVVRVRRPLLRAEACLTNIKVVGLNLDNVPNWLDDGWVKDMVNNEIADEECLDVTALVQAYLDNGGAL